MARYDVLHFAPGPATNELKALIHQASSARRSCLGQAADFLGIPHNTLNAQITHRTVGLPWLSVLAMVHYADFPLLNQWYLFPDTRWQKIDPLIPASDNLEKEVMNDPIVVLGKLQTYLRQALMDGQLDPLEKQRLADLLRLGREGPTKRKARS